MRSIRLVLPVRRFMMTSKNLSAVLYGKEDLRMEEAAIPEPSAGEVQLAIQACGICCTDLHWIELGGCGSFTVSDPIVIGHEASGIVTAIGEGVSSLKIGDRVALELGLPCRFCPLCKSGNYNLCKAYSHGGLTRFWCHPADFCHKLPEGVSLEEGALVEPVAVAVRACKRAGIQVGSNVLICGAGPIGLSAVMVAKAMGARNVCVTDIVGDRLRAAIECGATHTVLVTRGESVLSVTQRVCQELKSKVHSTVECCGAESSIATAIRCTRSGGVIVLVALEPPEITMPVIDAATREVDIRGSFSYVSEDYKVAISMIEKKAIKPEVMISHRFPLKETPVAIGLIRSHAPGVLKVMVHCNDSTGNSA